MDKVYYYYERDRENKPLITKCLVIKDGEAALGVAICSKKDQPNKKSGRKIAYSRAEYALKAKKNVLPIERDTAYNIQNSTQRGVYEDWKGIYFGDKTSQFTSFERRLLKIKPTPITHVTLPTR